MRAAKPAVMKHQRALLDERYDLANRPTRADKMSHGKAIQAGPRAHLAKGVTWESLSKMSPQEILEKNLFPAGFLPLPHANLPEGGMLFPQFHINEIKRQEGRDLTRFDLDQDLPEHFLPEFPPPFTSSTVTFSWNAGTGVSQYWLYVGPTQGGNQLHDQDRGTNQSATVTGLPTNGSTIHVRLWSKIGANWPYVDYTYRAKPTP